MHILNDGNKYFFFNSLSIEDSLTPKGYLFNFDEFGNCWLEDIEFFKLPEKIYDTNKTLRDKIKLSYDSYQKNLGILLTGNKGMGKSLMAKMICKEMDLPVIIINKKIPQSVNFVKFFNDIKQNYVLFVDEFEKLFNEKSYSEDKTDSFHKQEVFLSFMDGVLTNDHKVLFLLTTNESINEFFINRPSRIKFLVEYNELEEELFNMIVDDKLVNKDFKEDLENNVSFLNLNIDLLISIIEDINLFNVPFSSFANLYNYKFEQYRYDVHIAENGGTEKWNRTVNLDSKPKHNSRYLANYNVNNMIKFTKEEIIFESIDYNDDDEKRNVVVRMVPISKFMTTTFLR
jgi:hypothetical protein